MWLKGASKMRLFRCFVLKQHLLLRELLVRQPGLLVRQYNQSLTDLADILVQSKSMYQSHEACAKQFMIDYDKLPSTEKLSFLTIFSSRYQWRHDFVVASVKSYADSPKDYRVKHVQRLRDSLVPDFEIIFKEIGSVEGGVSFLVDLRKDLLENMANCSDLLCLASLQSMNTILRQVLSVWFGVGFLSLHRVTWQSPCDLLQKISEYEAVHPIRNVTDIKVRVGHYRRCYAFFHASMPREPLVILHVALVKGISDSIQSIVKYNSSLGQSRSTVSHTAVEEDPRLFDAAVFYSITSTKAGLQGIDLGNYLVRKALAALRSEFPSLVQFSSLSPIPGFTDWLITEINQVLGGARTDILFCEQHLHKLADFFNVRKCPKSVLKEVKVLLQTNTWFRRDKVTRALREPLMSLCARYVCLEKRRKYALNSVANFHLRNGACVWRINYLANTSTRGLAQSCGLMVNYRYFLERTEEYSRQYCENHVINVDEQVENLLLEYKK